MKHPLWSILIPAVPSRIEAGQASCTFLRLVSMAASKPHVEILMLADSKSRKVGMKRQALLDIARGEYVSFVDDDDFVSDEYVSVIAEHLREFKPDVVVFPILVELRSGEGIRHGVVQPGLDSPNEEFKDAPAITLRKPAHLAVWRREIALQAGFPDLMWGEDKYFMERACAIAKTESRIDQILYKYTWNEATSEAPNK